MFSLSKSNYNRKNPNPVLHFISIKMMLIDIFHRHMFEQERLDESSALSSVYLGTIMTITVINQFFMNGNLQGHSLVQTMTEVALTPYYQSLFLPSNQLTSFLPKFYFNDNSSGHDVKPICVNQLKDLEKRVEKMEISRRERQLRLPHIFMTRYFIKQFCGDKDLTESEIDEKMFELGQRNEKYFKNVTESMKKTGSYIIKKGTELSQKSPVKIEVSPEVKSYFNKTVEALKPKGEEIVEKIDQYRNKLIQKTEMTPAFKRSVEQGIDEAEKGLRDIQKEFKSRASKLLVEGGLTEQELQFIMERRKEKETPIKNNLEKLAQQLL